MDHEEGIKQAIARELQEEVGLSGDFTYRVIAVEEPALLDRVLVWQIRMIFEVKPTNMSFEPGEDGDEISFIDPKNLKDSEKSVERRVYEYSQIK
jgi:ADP-ribose pyrophosphatase YjhB (NUDIX family)